MKLRLILYFFISSFLFLSTIQAQIDMEGLDIGYYLPKTEYNPSIPSPKQFLGYEIGEWHVNHDKMIAYMRLLSEKSDRVSFRIYGETYEKRPLINLIITSPDHQANLDMINQKHQQMADPSDEAVENLEDLPAILYQGYSIHGDESSGGNAAMLVAYHLAAGESKEVLETLDKMVILFDPCYNPDGFQRYAAWVNATQDKTLITDPNDMSHNEPWPTGRTNHYWFDLNRDWLLLTHPESRGRIEIFQQWNPNVLTDHHEMGTNSSFFFQPGVPSRTNPLTPQLNQDLTWDIAEYHIEALDSIGSDYFTKERFDDFYYGKGSTYPDGQGCVGILFEQATSEGIIQESSNGLLSFPFCVRNQVVTSLSTHKAIVNIKDELLNYKQDFFKSRFDAADQDETKAYIVKQKDPWRYYQFLNILEQHNITSYLADRDFIKEGMTFNYEDSFVVPLRQKQYTLIKSIFEEQTNFNDSIFYDVSTWVFPYAFDSDFARLTDSELAELNLKKASSKVKWKLQNAKPSPCLIIPWDQYMAPKYLYQFQKDSSDFIRSAESFVLNQERFPAGSIYLNTSDWNVEDYNALRANASSDKIQTYPFNQNLDQLQTLGLKTLSSKSDQFEFAMLIGSGVNSYEAGDAWFQMDQRWHIPIAKIDVHALSRADLDRYKAIVIPDGRYDLTDKALENLESWVEEGGTMIVMRRGIEYFKNEGWYKMNDKAAMKGKEDLRGGGQVIGGSMFNMQIDLSDPLFFGYPDKFLPVFKKGTQWYQAEESEGIQVVGQYTEQPRISGYSSKENLFKAGGSAAVLKVTKGKGKVILMVDNPNFRGYWYGGSLLYANALFYTDK